MDVIKAQLARLQRQLSGLTASQKMLSAALVAIMAMTLVWWGRYAGEPEYQALLDQSLSQDDIAQITSALAAKNVSYTLTGDRIMVPADRKIEILADLGFAHLLPHKTDVGFDEIVKQMTPWDPADKTARLWTEAKQRTLSAVIDDFPGVREADVVIDPTDERRFDGHDKYSSAMVNIATRDSGDATRGVRSLAMAAADVVAGAVSGLSRGHVVVVVDGATIPVPDKSEEDSMLGGDTIIDTIRQNEEMYRTKILQQLGFINGLFVSVTVNVNMKKVETQQTTVDPKASGHLSVTEDEQSTDTSGGSGGGDTGASPNLQSNGALAVGGGGGGGGGGGNSSTSSETESKSTYQNVFGQQVTTTEQGPGDAQPIAASVRVPRDWFISQYKADHNQTEPDDTALAAWVKEESDKLRADVKSCTGIKADDAVTVNWYSAAAAVTGASLPPTASSPLAQLALSHVKEMAVGGMAAFSLFMVMMMVRKSVPAPIPVVAAQTSAAEKAGSQRLAPDSNIAGEVGEGDKSMDGMELDDETIKTQQMIDQVSTMVTENPDAAANLVKRWLNRT